MKDDVNTYGEIIGQVLHLRQRVYSIIYPEVKDVLDDPYDRSACVLYTASAEGRVLSSARIAFDGDLGIPEAALVPELVRRYREEGVRFAELGRFVIPEEARGVLTDYFRAFYHLGLVWGIENYLMFVPRNKVSLYRRLMNASVAATFDGLTFGSRFEYVSMVWRLADTTDRFRVWCGAEAAATCGGPDHG